MLKQCKEMNAGVMKIVLRDKSDKPMAAVVAIHGGEETEEIITAIEAIESKWSE